ncbi:MAG: membrane integrity-associated transporter subunit PqiC [Thiotrichales bacterium]
MIPKSPKWLLVLLSGALASCASVTPTRFYTLSAQSAYPDTAVSVATDATLGVGPIHFPRLLERPQIVTRTTPNEVQLAEFHQWGGSLKEEFARVLADNLASRSNTRIYLYPWESRVRPDYQILVSIDQFDGTLGAKLVLRGQWQIVDVARRETLSTERVALETQLDDSSYTTYAAGMSQTVARLADRVTAGLATLTSHRR